MALKYTINPFTRKFDAVSSDPTLVYTLSCDPTVAVLDAVMISGSIAVKAQADTLINSFVFGFVESKPSSTVCTVRTCAELEAPFTGLTEGIYFLDYLVAGGISTTPPPAGITGSIIIPVGYAISSSRFIINIGVRTIRS